ncbi:MAG: hypothetical protein IT258_02510 [Saprospiraceae bacterium]|nr:hypothetical protein [Saprospiraceae bacterium]
METLDDNFKNQSPEEISRIEAIKIDSIDLVDYIKKARIALMILLALNLVTLIFQRPALNEGAETSFLFVIQFLSIGIYVLAILFMFQKPKITLIAAFAVYVLPQVFVMVVYPASLFSIGTVVKGFIIYGFIKAIRFANEFEQLRRELKEYGEDLTFGEVKLSTES